MNELSIIKNEDVKLPVQPVRNRDDRLLIEAMQALAGTPGRRWLRERGGYEVGHMAVSVRIARDYQRLVSALSSALAPRTE